MNRIKDFFLVMYCYAFIGMWFLVDFIKYGLLKKDYTE